MAADPSYPLLPVFAFTSAALLLCVLTTNFVRQSWNLGVFFLCFWLFWTNLAIGINAIIWSDNVDIKFYVYCDIVTHLNLFTAIVQPACTLILTRRVYQLASLRFLNVKGRREILIDRTIEWFLGLGLPALVTGVFYYIVQNVRFRVVAAFGCTYAIPFTGLGIILIIGPQIILPFISVLFYCPKIVYVFYRRYRHNQLEANHLLHCHRTVPNSDYWRILALGCIDIAFTLPVNLARFIFSIEASAPVSPISFYNGWNTVHSNWKPISLSMADLLSKSTWPLISFYVSQWSRIILALVIFCLFGLTAEARAVYRRGISRILERFGCTPPVDTCDSIGELRFQSQSIPGIVSQSIPLYLRY